MPIQHPTVDKASRVAAEDTVQDTGPIPARLHPEGVAWLHSQLAFHWTQCWPARSCSLTRSRSTWSRVEERSLVPRMADARDGSSADERATAIAGDPAHPSPPSSPGIGQLLRHTRPNPPHDSPSLILCYRNPPVLKFNERNINYLFFVLTERA